MDRSIATGLASFAVTAFLLAISAIADARGAGDRNAPVAFAQMEGRIAGRFAAADTDGSGVPGRDEAAARRAVRQPEHRPRRFARMDANGDAAIGIAERD